MVEEIKKMKQEAEKFVKNKQIPLAERWKVLQECDWLTASFYKSPLGLDSSDYYELGWERYALIGVANLMERLEDNEYDLSKLGENWETRWKTVFMEYCCDNAIHSFENDW